MTARIAGWIRKHPVLALYILAFLFTWLGWGPQAAYSRGLFPFDSPVFYILGGVGPLLAVFIVLGIVRGKGAYGEPFQPFLIWRVGVVWYLVAVFGYYLLWIFTITIGGNLSAGLAKAATPLAVLSSFVVSFLAAIPEEVAWRGFALPRLQSRYSALTASLIIGLLWALWHLPLLLNTNSVMSSYPILLYLIDVVARSVIYTWIFNNTRGSLLFVTLFHAASNSAGTFGGVENLIVTYAAAAILVIVFGAAHLSRRFERPALKDAAAAAAQAD